MIAKVENPDRITSAEIVVGIPSYNEADSIAGPVEVATEGLKKYFPNQSAVIVNVDNHSADGTKEAFFNAPSTVPRIYVSTAEGVTGKGRNVHNLLEVAVELRADVILTLDADLTSVTPAWIRHLAEPILDGYDYVVPIYTRHKYDGTITKNIAYPMSRTLYGLRVRQPIGGDFGISNRLARCLLVEKTWSEDVSHFGIDIWMTTIAICRRFNVCQTFMGSPKIHRPKDPASDLGPMFSQVVGTIFQLMTDFEFLWKDSSGGQLRRRENRSKPGILYGFGSGQSHDPPEVKVSRDLLHESFLKGSKEHGEIWKEVLSRKSWEVVKGAEQLSCQKFYYPSTVWAHILFDFAVAYQSQVYDPNQLMSALVPFYHSRTLSFVNKAENMDMEGAERYLEDINLVFEEGKEYLIERWDQSLRDHGKTPLANSLQS
jgi:glycosyltransferase involved in cell wall biosynthesis